MSIDVDALSFDPELSQGARNAVFVCLKVQPEEKVTVITDLACEEIAASLVSELNAVGCRHRNFVLEEIAPRPLVDMPQAILDDMATSQVSIFAVKAQTNELKTRMQMCNLVNEKETPATPTWSTSKRKSCSKECVPISSRSMNSLFA